LKNENPDTYLRCGLARFNKKDAKGAIADFDKAIELKPSFTDAYVARGILRLEQGNTNDAIKDFDKAVEIEPKKTGPDRRDSN
jgi:tetratricopeptide (TPR) repeat protein